MGRSSTQPTTGLSGHLLCAVPQLLDPNFHRSVILMLEHEDSGALGLVLNQRTTTSVKVVAESLGLDWAGDPEQLVRLGGPVEQVRGWILHDQPDWDPECTELLTGLFLTTSLDHVLESEAAPMGDDGARVQVILGYAGWGAGQIEGEMAAGSWVAVPIVDAARPGMGVEPRWVLECDPTDMWHHAIRAIGVDPERLVGLQSDASMMQ